MLGILTSGPGLAGIAIAFCLAFGGVQTWRLKGCQADAAAQRAQVAILADKLATQNAAVEKLASDAAAKQREGAKALAKAETRARVWDEQAARLAKALEGRKADGPTDCRAAWQELRK